MFLRWYPVILVYTPLLLVGLIFRFFFKRVKKNTERENKRLINLLGKDTNRAKGFNNFDAWRTKRKVICGIKKWFRENGDGCNAIIGISGGKDSSVAAALCVEALGKNRVIGVLMPNLKQDDIEDSYLLVNSLGIKHITTPITLPVSAIINQVSDTGVEVSEQAIINLPPKIRTAALYVISQSINGRVINTTNLSESWVGYITRHGDLGDFSPLAKLTSTEVVEVGKLLNIPKSLVIKTPSDGLCGKTDEDNLGFSYERLDTYIRTGECDNDYIKKKIDHLHQINAFKTKIPDILDPFE